MRKAVLATVALSALTTMIVSPVAAINTTIFRLPMHGTLRWGQSSSLSEVRHVLIEVVLADGSSGVAEAPPRPTIYGETVQSITSVIAGELAPRIVGESPDVAARQLHEVKYNYTAKGTIDMALHAAVAQHRGISLASQIGASPMSKPDANFPDLFCRFAGWRGAIGAIAPLIECCGPVIRLIS